MKNRLKLFEAIGVEIEIMVIDRGSYSVRPVVDQLFAQVAGKPTADIEAGTIDWSNELVNHVLEFKTHRPEKNFQVVAAAMHEQIRAANQALSSYDAMLLPGAAHPFMDPFTETVLWPEDHREIYELYDRVFNCRGHGWSNLQSVHINLPFADDREFGRLHAAVRAILPLIPALAASSPILDGKKTPWLDARMQTYMVNQQRLPALTGRLIPEPVYSEAAYEKQIFKPIAEAIAPFDPEGITSPYFLNSRGAIARFDRGSIEIRVMDSQECPQADLGLVEFWVVLIKDLVDRGLPLFSGGGEDDTEMLRAQFVAATERAGEAAILDSNYPAQFGLSASHHDLNSLIGTLYNGVKKQLSPIARQTVEHILGSGCLARRMLRKLPHTFSRTHLQDLCAELCDALAANQPLQ